MGMGIDRKRVVVTGASGLLGRQVLLRFQEAGWIAVGTGFSRSSESIRRVDLSDEGAISSLISETRPDVLVHCAANRFPDKVEANPEAARKVNVGATEALAVAAAKTSAIVIYISTDYVFSGKQGEAPYESDSDTSPMNLYGQLKLDGEQAVLNATKDFGNGIILRIPVLYGQAETPSESSINSLMDTVWKAQTATDPIHMDNWGKRYPTNTEDVARVVHDIAEKYSSSGPSLKSLPKVLQFSSEDQFTKYEICQLFAEILGLSIKDMIADTAALKADNVVSRPFDTHLSTATLKSLGIATHTQSFQGWWRWHVKAFKR